MPHLVIGADQLVSDGKPAPIASSQPALIGFSVVVQANGCLQMYFFNVPHCLVLDITFNESSYSKFSVNNKIISHS